MAKQYRKSNALPVTESPRVRQKMDILGYTSEGLPVYRPPFEPKSFTVEDLKRVVGEVKRKQDRAEGVM